MTVEQTSTPDFITTLTQTAAAFRDSSKQRPPASAVVSALLEAEKAAKHDKITYPLESLLGAWRLGFVVTVRKAPRRGGIVMGRGWYIPKLVKAQISFSKPAENSAENPKMAEIGNQLKLGSLLLQFTGSAQYLGKKNLLAFDFNQIQLALFGRGIYSGNFRRSQAQAEDFERQSIAKLPFFSFFLVTDKFIAARGRGGGLAIWIRE